MALDPTHHERQQRWRARRGPSLTVHLDEDQLRALDWLAVQLAVADPHDPSKGQIGSRSCGRSAAIRLLVDQLKERQKVPGGLPDTGTFTAFWRREAVWRRSLKAEYSRSEDGPELPWTPKLARLARAALQRLGKG